ncbi:hypothetical protein IHE31_12060 [Mycetohabitans rhizoxinica]|uniref:2-methylcitrate dehydratase n=2 Tax=Mycetohabitans rhizoxinica TaxID=412963 RepID=E5ASP3_MYCRK|nr:MULTISPECIES: 2-methylcitrate dehydratase [Mycetohabitans]MCF7696246.1 hypothetical protein [Mycetohabitans sp. B2]MCG1047578.1 hypothetical protein [Mycetohabitans sp. B6]CBW75625.1 2-methylcitrate dehydratase (EC 4.2.1.79) / 2-methylisocitrate dehydratase (EC 4.2.1.99) [Mycetohabitans rhizoxinica HKI 454]
MSPPISNVRPEPDAGLVDIVDYVQHYRIDSALALETARWIRPASRRCPSTSMSICT